jgi:hypothetical protein
MISLLRYLAALGAITWFGLKAFDWAHAVRYERRQARAHEVNQAFADGFHAAMGEYGKSKVQAYKVVRATPDRPKPTAYWGGKSVDEICRELEGSV